MSNEKPKSVKFITHREIPEKIHPTPAHKCIPTWYKMLTGRVDGIESASTSTVKMCMPFGDALKIGWILKAPFDITVRSENNLLQFEHTGKDDDALVKLNPPKTNRTGNSKFKPPNFILDVGFGIRTPEGYSTLITPPLNRNSSDLAPMSLLIDTANQTEKLEIPIRIPTDGKTIIKAGDPLAQVIPLKQSTLSGSKRYDSFDIESKLGQYRMRLKNNTHLNSGYYRKKVWIQKENMRMASNLENESSSYPEYAKESPEHTTSDLCGNVDEPMLVANEEHFDLLPKPNPSSEHIPEDYTELLRDMDMITDQMLTWVRSAMSIGQIIPLERELNVTFAGGEFKARAAGDAEGYHKHDSRQINMENQPIPFNVVNIHSNWLSLVPKGYSVLHTSPLNHSQHNYISYSGLIDADVYFCEANAPGMYATQNDTVLPRGMPTVQIIPIKRDEMLTVAEVVENNEE